MTDLYADLGVARDATQEEISAAFRREAKRHHPDAGGDPEAFKRVQAAEHVLGDPERRARYDETGNTDAPPADPVEAAALAMAGSLILQAIGQSGATVEPVVALTYAMELVQDGQRRQADERRRAERDATKTRRLLIGLKPKDPERDPLRAILNGHLHTVDRFLDQCTQSEAVHARALEILKGYEAEPEAATGATSSFVVGNISFTTSNTTAGF